jgi:hypothetical protein
VRARSFARGKLASAHDRFRPFHRFRARERIGDISIARSAATAGQSRSAGGTAKALHMLIVDRARLVAAPCFRDKRGFRSR